MINIVIFDRHFLGKSENDSNNYQFIFHEDSKPGLRILIIRVYIFDLSWSQIFTTLLLIHLYVALLQSNITRLAPLLLPQPIVPIKKNT